MESKKKLIDARKYEEDIILIMRCWNISPCLSPQEAKRSVSNLQTALNVLHDQPTVDAVEVVHGRWIPIIDEPTPLRKMPMLSGYKCSVCGRYEEEEEPYCNCGAKMDGDKNGK